MKWGPKPNGKWVELENSVWYNACEIYMTKYSHMNYSTFLKGTESGPHFNGRKSQCVSFGQKIKLYKADALVSDKRQRNVVGQYLEVEHRLVEYLRLRQQYYKIDKCGLSWQILKERAATFAEEQKQSQPEKYASFNASSGWLSNVLKQNNFVGMSLHGEAAEADEEEHCNAINKFWKDLQEKIEFLNISQSCIYNADQTGLFYQKLPN